MADARASRARAARHKSSSLFPGTKIKQGALALFYFCGRRLERERGRENGSFPVAEVLEPLGSKAQYFAKIAKYEQ